MTLNIKKIPVFVFPNTVKFYLNSKTTHKQLLTLYNPYDFPVKFKVLCTAPNKYAVIDPEGSIGPHMLVDIVIRHTMPTAGNSNITDKFRIFMEDHTTKQILGRRDIEATLISGEVDNISNDGDFQSLPYSDRGSTVEGAFYTNRKIRSRMQKLQGWPDILCHSVYAKLSRPKERSSRPTPHANSTNYVICIITGLVCVIALLLPTLKEAAQPSNIPGYLHISMNIKLVLAYVLGLVSMVIFRP